MAAEEAPRPKEAAATEVEMRRINRLAEVGVDAEAEADEEDEALEKSIRRRGLRRRCRIVLKISSMHCLVDQPRKRRRRRRLKP